MTWPGWGRAAWVFVVVALFGSAQVQVWGGGVEVPGGPPVEAALAAGVTLPLLWAWRGPLSVLLVVLACAFTDHALDGHLGQPWFAMLLALFALGERASTARRVVGTLATAALTLAVDIPRLQGAEPVDEVLPGWFILGGAFGLGVWMAARRREHRRLVAEAAVAAKQREDATRAAVAQERAVIARELHDVVAHSLAVIVLQAQGAQRVVGTDDLLARQALGAIEEVGRQGADELRRLLDVLATQGPPGDSVTPGLAALDTLVARVRAAGLAVDLDVEGPVRTLPPGLDVSVFRILQESLTNTLKHAGAARADVVVRFLAGSLQIDVTDDGKLAAAGPNGHVGRGLIGMRERAALYGGTVASGPAPSGGYRVSATFPLEAS